MYPTWLKYVDILKTHFYTLGMSVLSLPISWGSFPQNVGIWLQRFAPSQPQELQ